MRARNPPRQDAHCLLQGRKSQGEAPEHEVRLPRVHLQTARREESQTELSVRELHPGGQRESSQSHAGDHATDELSQSNRTKLAGHFPAAQSHPSGLASLLWEVLPLGYVPGLQALQQDVGGLGDAKVQTVERAQDAGKPASRTHSREAAASVHTLAARDRGLVCLMGAV